MNWYAYCGGDPINCVDLWGLSQESDRNLLKVKIDDASGFQDAATRYLLGGKEGVLGQTSVNGIALINADGQVIHTFTNDKAIKQYANSLDTDKGNLADNMGNLSTVTGVLSDISELPGVSKVSQVSGAIKTISDIKEAVKNPSVSTVSDVVIDTIGFVPNGGAIASYGLSETKEAVEVIEEMKKEYQTKENIEKYLPPEQRNKDMEHVIEKAVWQEIKSLFGGK